MPVTMQYFATLTEEYEQSIDRIQADLSESHIAQVEFKNWLQSVGDSDLWLAFFNQRVVGYGLVSCGKLKAVAVHKATRRRGVGTRMVEILACRYPDISIENKAHLSWVKRLLDCD